MLRMDKIQQAAKMIKNAKQILVLTGAGISTGSNIPDFRSKTGLYSKAPEEIMSNEYFFKKPDRFYEFLLQNVYYPEAKPNLGHQIIAGWENEGRILYVVTQNIDGLHQEAGSEKVIEFHGTIKRCMCRQCKKVYTPDELIERKEKLKQSTKDENEKNLFYVCEACTGDINKRYIKPDVVLYGEMGYWLSENPFHIVQCIAYDADLILVLGSTMQVYPFRTIPEYRNTDKNTQMIIINQGETPYDKNPWVHVIKDDISKTLEEIQNILKKETN